MTAVTRASPTPGAGPHDDERYRPKVKTDQWICWWSIPIFYSLFGLIFVVLTRVMPPPSPHLSTEQIVQFFHVLFRLKFHSYRRRWMSRHLLDLFPVA